MASNKFNKTNLIQMSWYSVTIHGKLSMPLRWYNSHEGEFSLHLRSERKKTQNKTVVNTLMCHFSYLRHRVWRSVRSLQKRICTQEQLENGTHKKNRRDEWIANTINQTKEEKKAKFPISLCMSTVTQFSLLFFFDNLCGSPF